MCIRDSAIIIPARAVKTSATGTTVSVKKADGTFADQSIVVGRKGDESVEVVSGLDIGTTIASSRIATKTSTILGG